MPAGLISGVSPLCEGRAMTAVIRRRCPGTCRAAPSRVRAGNSSQHADDSALPRYRIRESRWVTMRSTKRAYDRRHRSETPRILQWPHDHLCGWLEATMTDKMIHRYLEALAVVATIALFPACSSKRATDVSSLTPPFLETPVAARIPATAATVAKGKEIYEANCVQCHGPEGRGDGYGAPFLVPTPRDFTAGQFKFRTTASGQLPTDDDLFRTISRGANGTGMPPWKYLLSDEDRWALVEYVKTFDQRFAAAKSLRAMPLPDTPGKSRSVDRGRQAYARMQCEKCHGQDGRGVGPS